MVHGLEKFKAYFQDSTHQYVLIGGTACSLLLDDLGSSFRSTKDIDMVLIVEALDVSFGRIFWKFIEDGGYENREKSNGSQQFYRFTRPKDDAFPSMVELFSKLPQHIELAFDTGLTPIHIDESIFSLSAILLNDNYYETLIKGKRTLDGYSILDIETIVLFKIRAWLDLNNKKTSGKTVHSHDINKHKNDVFRLLSNMTYRKKIAIPKEIYEDVITFTKRIVFDKPDLNNLGISSLDFDQLIALLTYQFIDE